MSSSLSIDPPSQIFLETLKGSLLISEAENFALCQVPDEAEVLAALKSMGSYKAPGPDGMVALFFKHYWSIAKEDVVSSVRSFFLRGFMLKRLNHTNITLIPKKDNPYMVNQFRPSYLSQALQCGV